MKNIIVKDIKYRKATMQDLESIAELITKEIGTCKINPNEGNKKSFEEIYEGKIL